MKICNIWRFIIEDKNTSEKFEVVQFNVNSVFHVFKNDDEIAEAETLQKAINTQKVNGKKITQLNISEIYYSKMNFKKIQL